MKESHSKVISNSVNFREVHRDITQNQDGTVKTYEHETVQEQVCMQQQQITRELSQAKTLFLNRKTTEFEKQLQRWMHPRFLHHKYCADRIKQFCGHVKSNDGDLPLLREHKSLLEVLDQQQRSLIYTCDDIGKTLDWIGEDDGDIIDAINAHKSHMKTFTAETKTYNFGSRYLLTAVEAIIHKKRKRETITNILTNLKEQESRHDRQAVLRNTAQGGYGRLTPVLFPFTEEQQEDLAHANIACNNNIPSKYYENYVRTAFTSLGKDHMLMVPVLEETITTLLMLLHGSVDKVALPDLITITGCEEKQFVSFPFAPIDFWGACKNTGEYFCCCEFRMESGEIHEKIWIELPLLLQTPQYANLAKFAFREFVMDQYGATIDQLATPDQLIDLDPNCAEFRQLKEMRRHLNQIEHDQDTQKQLRLLKKQYGHTVSKLKRRQTLL